MNALKIYAGAHALQHIKNNSLAADDIKMILAASGGPKWFAIESIDRFLVGDWFKGRTQPLHLLGTSAGAWRMACYAQSKPVKAIERFLEAYLSQQYSLKPSPQEIASSLERMMHNMLGSTGVREIISNPVMKFNTLAARSRGIGAAQNKSLQILSLTGAMLANMIGPVAMRPFVERVLFSRSDELPINKFPGMPAHKVELTESNVSQAILATGAIPVLIEGVKNIAGAPKGVYRDGGLTDYQFDLPCKPDDGLVLYPHYSVTPPKGVWFDKMLKWRKANKHNYSHTVILAPSDEMVASLPGGKVPDRQDFYDITDYPQRRQQWQQSLNQLQQVGDELAEIVQKDKWAEVVEPLPW